MAKFALLCQGARLQSNVLEYHARHREDDDVWWKLDEDLQNTLTAALDLGQLDHDLIRFVSFVYRLVFLLSAQFYMLTDKAR